MDEKNPPNVDELIHSPAYRLAYKDVSFLSEDDLRPVRMQLELLKTEMRFTEHNVRSTIVVFGSASLHEPERARREFELAKSRLDATPDDFRRRRAVEVAESRVKLSVYYDMAQKFARIVSENSQNDEHCDYLIVTGGGPGIMEAANRGAWDVGAKSAGLNIVLPREQKPNPYISPELCFRFHYFAMRKIHFLLRAKALVAFPGGFGTFDELFQTLTLRQTDRMQKIPVILVGNDFWNHAVDFTFLADSGVISDEDLDLFRIVDSAEEAWGHIKRFHAKY